jgi:hypothetical protein
MQPMAKTPDTLERLPKESVDKHEDSDIWVDELGDGAFPP